MKKKTSWDFFKNLKFNYLSIWQIVDKYLIGALRHETGTNQAGHSRMEDRHETGMVIIVW